MISETSSTKLDKKKTKLDTLCFLWLSTHGTTLIMGGPEIMKDSVFFQYLWQFSLFKPSFFF